VRNLIFNKNLDDTKKWFKTNREKEVSLISKIGNVSINKIQNRLARKLQQRQFNHHAHPKNFDWAWEKKGFNRIAVVNYLIAKRGGLTSQYLEIGCAANTLFDSVASLNKIGVDPDAGGTHRMTSDEFFEKNREDFDVIFIDGLHEYTQVRKDALNSLKVLKEGGWIGFHDFLPSSWKEQHLPRISNNWTGDCWKLAVELAQAKGIEFKILDIDHGVGLIKKTSSEWHISDFSDELKTAEFDKFVEVVGELPLCSFEEAMKSLG